jgi:NitT/TauT family transport system permease protein
MAPSWVMVGSGLAVLAVSDAVWALFLAAALYGLGAGFGNSAPAVQIANTVQASSRGSALGLYRTFNDLGLVLGASVMAGMAATVGLMWGLWLNVFLVFAAAAAYLVLPRSGDGKRSDPADEPAPGPDGPNLPNTPHRQKDRNRLMHSPLHLNRNTGAVAELPVKTFAAAGVPSERELPQATILARAKANLGMAEITLINLTVFFLLWQLIASADVFPQIFFPSPVEIAKEYQVMIGDGTLASNGLYSLTNLTVGFTISVVLGVSIGLAAGTMRWFNTIISPYYWALNAMPNLAILPLIVLWFGFGMESKVLLIVLNATLPILISTLAGVSTVDQTLIRVAKSLNATRMQRFRMIVIPFTLPFILTGCKLGLSSALTTTVVSEMLGSSEGLGYVIIRKVEAFNPAGVFAMLLLLAALALIMVNGMAALQYRITPWARNVRV